MKAPKFILSLEKNERVFLNLNHGKYEGWTVEEIVKGCRESGLWVAYQTEEDGCQYTGLMIRGKA